MTRYLCGAEMSGALIPHRAECPFHGQFCGTADELAERLRLIYNIIRNDAFAATFQTMGQYRTALLANFRPVPGTTED